MLIDALDVMRYVKTSAGRSSLNVVFEKTNQPRHDGKTIYLPKVTVKTSEKELLQMMSSVDHEVAHDLYSDFEILKEKNIDTSSILGYVFNLLEDSRCNNLEANEYAGFKELWEQTTPSLITDIHTSFKKPSETNDLIGGLIRWESTVSRELFPLCALAGEAFSPKLDEKLTPFSDKLRAAQVIKAKKAGTKATFDLACEIFDALGGDSKKELEEAQKRKGGKPSKEEGDEEGGEEDESSASEAKDGEGKKGRSSKEDWMIKRVVPKELKAKELTPTDVGWSKVGLLYKTRSAGAEWTLTPPDKFIVIDYDKNSIPEGFDNSPSSYFVAGCKEKEGTDNAPDNFANQVRKEIQIRAKSRYEFGVKKGKLDQSRLFRVISNQPGYSDRVFKNKITSTVLDASVSVLIDMSGSMGGVKSVYAAKAALLLNHVFQVLQVPCEIVGFTDSGISPVMYVYKAFNKFKIDNKTLFDYIATSATHMTGNPDGDCILWAYNRIVNRKERKKLLIVMSDGQPAASRFEGDLHGFTLKVVKEIEARKKVEIYGLGLCDESVKDFYKHNSTVNQPEEIPQRLLELIERKLLNDL